MGETDAVGTLAFFPWLAISERLTTDAFELIPYRRSPRRDELEPSLQATCDSLIELYRVSPTVSVQRATILRGAGRGTADPLDEAGTNQAHRWGELIAFSGLAARRFFDPLSYANREAFRLVVQNFDDPTQGVFVISRRRDGSLRSFVSRSAAMFLRPLHVQIGAGTGIDAPLLRALLARAERPDWGRFGEAIQQFNGANADSPDVLQETEVVNLVGAFERLFDLSRGKEDELAERFVAVFEPSQTIAPTSSPRVLKSANSAKYVKRKTMREVWIRDFFQLRNQHAHGKIEPQTVSLWTLREHLLFAALIFPLVVKCLLATDKLYEMTAQDEIYLDAFEALLEPDHFVVEPHPWYEIVDEVRTRRWIEGYVKNSDDESEA